MLVPLALLAVVCLVLGLVPGAVLAVLGRVTASLPGLTDAVRPEPRRLLDGGRVRTVRAGHACGARRRHPRRTVCGGAAWSVSVARARHPAGADVGLRRHAECAHRVHATAFSKPLLMVFREVYRPTREVEALADVSPYFPSEVRYRVEIEPTFERHLYDPLVRGVMQLAERMKVLQAGSLHAYLGYVLLLGVALLIWLGGQ